MRTYKHFLSLPSPICHFSGRKFRLLNNPKKAGGGRRKNKFHNPSTPIDFRRRSHPDLAGKSFFLPSSPGNQYSGGRHGKKVKKAKVLSNSPDVCDRNLKCRNTSRAEQPAELAKCQFGAYKSMFNAFASAVILARSPSRNEYSQTAAAVVTARDFSPLQSSEK
jgi:hypothetical protein